MLVIVPVVLVGFLASAAVAEEASVLLEKGIYQEETVGNVDAAIDVYKKILEDDQANRAFVAQAQYRLGTCYLKKGEADNAVAAFKKLIDLYPDQENLVAQARERIADARGKLAGAEVAKIVDSAVMTISTCAETDPRVGPALESLKGLDEKTVVADLVTYLDSDAPTVRRSAVYILWKGDFSDIDAAVPALMKLASHEEDLTRGMAAITLGANKVAPCFETIAGMTANDKSGYARRAAAYALGLLGDPKARPVLEKALNDPDSLVRANAKAALDMLSKAASSGAAPTVVSTLPVAFANDVPATLDKITVTFDQPMMDGSWSWTGGGETFPKTTGRPSYDAARTTCTYPVKLEPGKVYWVGINSPSHNNFKTPAYVPARRYVILFATAADGKPTPIPDDLLQRGKVINASAAQVAAAPPAADNSPKIVSTSPITLSNDVSPDLDNMTVTFDRPMMDGSWSWTGGGDTYPKTTQRPSYDAAKTTCTLPVKLEPGKVYWVGINSPSHKNFKTPDRVPATWYIILFATRGADGKPTPIPNDLLKRAKEINGR